MEIIKHGKYQIQKYKIRCYICGCIFTYAEQDIHSNNMPHNPLYVDCPECNTWNRHECGRKIDKLKEKLK